MPPKKKTSLKADDARKRDPKTALVSATEIRLARIPSLARFFLVVVGSLLVSSVLFTFTSRLTRGDHGLVSKHLEEWWEVGGLVAWRAVEVGLAWVLGFDSWDVASFLFLTHLPTYFLLGVFYGVRPTSALASFAITILSTVIPFALLRRVASVHELSHATSSAVANRAILQDRLTTTLTTLLAAAIYSVVLYFSYESWLPAQLVVHFETIPDISAAHAGPAGLPTLFLTLLSAGYAARDLLFVSSTGYSTTSSSGESNAPANGEVEYLVQALYRKTWCQLSAKTRILASRTLILTSSVLLNTIVQVAGTIQRVSVHGAFIWGAVWSFATLVVGITYGWIEAVEGV